MSAADAVLIDRGDLSREIPLEHVPYYQKVLIRQANRWNRPVYGHEFARINGDEPSAHDCGGK